MNDELKTCPICENAVQVGSQESALVNALRAQLADAQAEIARLKKLLEGRKVPMPQETKVYIGEYNPDINVYFGEE
jgi:hypothetical protein